MRTPGLLLFAAGAFFLGAGSGSAGDAPKDAAAKEYARFEGTWTFVSMDIGGKKLTGAGLKGPRLILKGNHFILDEGQVKYGGTYKVEVAQKPKRIDVTFTEGPEKGKTSLGIYELEGDTYKVCIGLVGKDRPTEFVSKPGSGHVLQELKREKGADAIQEERKRLTGTWQSVSYALDGQEAPAKDLAKIQLLFEADGKAHARQEGKTFIAGDTKIDPTKEPRTIDITFTQGDSKGQTSLGIYKVDGETLTICRAVPGKPRPTEFASKPGSGHTLMSYRREKK